VDIEVTLPAAFAPIGSGEGSVGSHRARWEAGLLTVTPVAGTRYIEQVLSTLFLDTLGPGGPDWISEFEEARSRAAMAGDVLAVEGPTLNQSSWWDRYVFSADLAHRLVFERRFNKTSARTCTWILANPGTGDLMQTKNGGRRRTPSRGNLGVMINRTQAWAAQLGNPWTQAGSVTVVNLFSARSVDLASFGWYVSGQGAVQSAIASNHPLADDVLVEAASRAVGVVAAWGPTAVGRFDDPTRPRRVRHLLADAGVTLHGMYGTYKGRWVRWISVGEPRYTLGLPADATPTPLGDLLADTGTPVA
jgi:hypothetical protein